MMKLRFGLVAAACFLRATAGCFAWEIKDFSTDIRVLPDSSLDVTETIIADFTGESRHGIFRTIPVRYRDKYGNTLALRLKVLLVADDEAGHPCEFAESRLGRFRKIRIGSVNALVTGVKTYRIRYRVDRATALFDDHDELYWNATGNEWPVAIRHASATVALPAAVGEGNLHGLAFTGAYGTTTGDGTVRSDAQSISYETRRELRPLEGLTIVAGWPKGVVAPPGWKQRTSWFLADNWPLGLPLLTALGLGLWWYLYGRDPRGRGTIVVQYEPPQKLTPAEIGTVLDERCDMRDISATIIDLAARGYLRIKEIKHEGIIHDSTDYQFVKLLDYANDPNLRAHEKAVLRGIFNGDHCMSLSNLEGTFYTELPIIRDAVYESVVRQGFFPQDPQHLRVTYRAVGAFVAAVGFIAAVVPLLSGQSFPWTVAGALGVAASGIVVVLFAPILPRKTPAGARLHEDILGFEEYLMRAEQQELQVSEQQQLFERLLPYAMALGVAHLWSKRFDHLKLQPPTWYQAEYGSQFLATMCSRRLGNASATFARSLAIAPRSTSLGGSGWSSGTSGFGGGGFSGGGGGGGGGGAW